MLDSAVTFLSDQVNDYLLKRTGSDTVKVVPGNLVDETGKWAIGATSVGLALINVEEERTLRAQVPDYVYINGSHVVLQPEIKLNLYLMFAARHTDYDHALRYISHVLTFFQAHPSFTPDAYPGLDASIEKLNVELVSYGPEQLNQLWAYLGAKYLPSVIYRVRMVVLQDIEPSGIGQPITSIETALHDK